MFANHISSNNVQDRNNEEVFGKFALHSNSDFVDAPNGESDIDKYKNRFNNIQSAIKVLYRASKLQRHSLNMSGIHFRNTLELFHKLMEGERGTGNDIQCMALTGSINSYQYKKFNFNQHLTGKKVNILLLNRQVFRMYTKIEDSLTFLDNKIISPLISLEETLQKISFYIQYRDNMNSLFHNLVIQWTELNKKSHNFLKSVCATEEATRVKLERQIRGVQEDLELANDKLRVQFTTLFEYCNSYFENWFGLYYFTICRVYYDLHHFMIESSEYRKLLGTLINQKVKPYSESTNSENRYSRNNLASHTIQAKENLYSNQYI